MQLVYNQKTKRIRSRGFIHEGEYTITSPNRVVNKWDVSKVTGKFGNISLSYHIQDFETLREAIDFVKTL